jgi:MFS family permease
MNSDVEKNQARDESGRGITVDAAQPTMMSTITGLPADPTNAPTSLIGYQGNIWKLYIIRALFWTHFFAAVMVPFYTQWGHVKLSTVFIINAWFMLWNFFLEVPTGTVADFLGRKISLAVGGLVAAVAALVYISQPSLSRFLIAEVLFATAYTLHSGADEALAYDSLKLMNRTEDASRVLSRMEAFKLFGINLGTLTGSLIAAHWGLAAPMAAYALPAFLAFLVALSLREVTVDTTPTRRARYHQILFDGARFFVRHKAIFLVSIELAITNALAWGLIWLFQPLLTRSGMPIAYFGFVHAAACLAQILFLSQVQRLEKLFGSKRRLLLVATTISGLAFILLGVNRMLPIVIAGIVVGFAFSLPRIPIYSAYINAQTPSDKRATVLSFSSMCRTIIIVIVNPLTGYAAERSLSMTMLILGGSLCILPWFSRIEERHLAND